jgi:hypothetical protein
MKHVLIAMAGLLLAGTVAFSSAVSTQPAAAVTMPAQADPRGARPECGTAEEVLAHFRVRFGEDPLVHGMNASGHEMILLMSPSTRTWTLLLAQGEFACLVMAGTGLMPGSLPRPHDDPA